MELVAEMAYTVRTSDPTEFTARSPHGPRLAIDFDTGDDRYGWLTTSLFVARGRLLGTGHIEYDVRRVT